MRVIQHPLKGKVPFKLYPFQEKSINDFKEHNYNVILKKKSVRYFYIDWVILYG